MQQALELDTDNSGLLRLREAIRQAQQRAASFKDGVSRARQALQRGDLDQARQAIDRALSIEPNDPAAKTLAITIARKQEAQVKPEPARKDELFQRSKESVLAVNLVEKAMADAKMLLSLNEAHEAEAALDKVRGQIFLVPPDLRRQVEKLRRDIGEKLPERGRNPFTATVAEGELPAAADSATLFGQPDVQEVEFRPPRKLEPPPPSPPAIDRRELLEELLEPRKTGRWAWSRQSWSWLAPTVIILILGVFSIFLFKTKNPSRAFAPATAPESSTAAPSYAEINAEPWGTVKQVFSLNGKKVLELNDATPLRVSLPAGKYIMKVEGPNAQTETIRIEVPRQGGKSYFVLFRKPDVEKIVTSP